MDWGWLTSATSPWWSAPVTSLLTLGAGAAIGRWSAGKQAADAKVESDAQRSHVETLADKQHEADRQARLTEAAEQDRAATESARRESAVRALESVAAVRASLAQSAKRQPARVSGLVSQPVPEVVVSDFISATSRLSVQFNNFSPDWELENLLNEYVVDWPALDIQGRKNRSDEIDVKLIGLRATVIDLFRAVDS